MEFRQLKTFREVATTLHFSRAAQKLNMAQSSVSAQIRGLEEDLGVKLFDRIGHRVLLTEAGDKLLAYASRIVDMTDEIRSQISGTEDSQGRLTIRIPETIAAVYAPRMVERYSRECPGVKLNFINCSDRRLREELNSGRIDLAFLMTESVHFKEVNVELLRSEPLALIAGAAHPFATRRRLGLGDLEGELLLLLRTD
jgi:DNA-binding transcriptional LysR family regulator